MSTTKSLSATCALFLIAEKCVLGAITDLIVIEGEHSDCPEGYGKISHSGSLNGDLNQGSGGEYIWLCVRESVSDDPITDLTIVAENDGESGCGDLDGNWHRVTQQQGSNGDFNHGSGGKYIYLCYRKNKPDGHLASLNLVEGDCGAGETRVLTDRDSNGDFNQGAGGKYIFMCFARGCRATEVQGEWVAHGGQIATASEETWSIGTHYEHSESKTEDWKQSVSVTVSQGWKLLGEEGSVEVSGEIAHETSTSYQNSWSVDETSTFKVTWSDADVGKQPWQFQFSPSDTCGHTEVSHAGSSSAPALALTEHAGRPPCCVPGYALDAPAYKVCATPDSMIPDGEKYGCTASSVAV